MSSRKLSPDVHPSNDGPRDAPPPANRSINIRIHGMTCGGCVARVESALRSVPGAADAAVNLLAESARVTGDGSPALSERLISAVRDAGYDAELVPGGQELAATDADDPRRRETIRRHRQAMLQAIGLALPILALEHLGPHLQSSYVGGEFGWRMLQALLALMLLVSPAGGPILAGALRALVKRSPNMDLLIGLGVVVAMISSIYGSFALRADFIHFHAAAVIILLVTVGRYLEARAKGRASAAVAALAKRMPRFALVKRNDRWQELPLDQVDVNDLVVVAAQQTIPIDGVVIDGRASLDESLMTGEPMPRPCGPNDLVHGGSLMLDGQLSIRAARPGSDSALTRIMQLTLQTQAGHTPMQRLADRVAGVFVPIVVALAALVFALWLAFQGRAALPAATRAAIAVLVVACPCAMGLATPTVIVVASGLAALRGILARDAAMLESLGRIDTVVWDKTGTLTAGKPSVVEVKPLADAALSQQQLLAMCAGAEMLTDHPLAKAVVAYARRLGVEPIKPETFELVPGGGVIATIAGKKIVVGSFNFLAHQGVDAQPLAQFVDDATRIGRFIVAVAVDGLPATLILLGDEIRPSAAAAVARLARLDIRSVMVTGDAEPAARTVATTVGLDDFRAAASPDDKVAFVRDLRAAGRRVAVVGDGVNDAAALAAADVGIAFATGADVAVESAGLNLVGSTPHLVADAVDLARASVRIIRQNLVWAFAYNIVMLPLAATGTLPPGLAAGAMMLSSLTVVLNALRLPRVLGWATPAHPPSKINVASSGATA